MPHNNLNSKIMTHLNYNEFTKLMKNKGETTVLTKDGFYEFRGIGNYEVYIKHFVKLKEDYQIGKDGKYIVLKNIVTETQAQCMYMSL